MLKVKLFASGFLVIFASISQAELLNVNGVTDMATNPSFAASDSPAAFDDAFAGIASGDKNDYSPVYIGVSPDSNVSLSFGVFDIEKDGHITNGVIKSTLVRRELNVAAKFKEVNKIDFSDDKHFVQEYFIFAKKISNVPDPSSFFLLAVGVLALVAARRSFSA